MISYVKGDLFEADVDALVNTVNCVGFMGRGIALQFKKAFPGNFGAYAEACQHGEVVPGRMFVFETGQLNPRFIVNFPTKRHWRGASRMEDIDAGLVDLARVIRERGIRSIAVPPLGSGLGGLDWDAVKPRIAAALEPLSDVEVKIFEPLDQGQTVQPKRAAKVPEMTPSRAALIGLMDRYLRGLMEPNVTLLEVHKLCYFLQAAGQRLRLQFRKGHYGPYAANLRFVLNEIEGYYTAGFHDGGEQPTKQISLVPGALEAAQAILDQNIELCRRFEHVGELVEGFETPFGLELLATAHWVATEEGADTPPAARAAFEHWNTRKSQFTERQIGIALERLGSGGWLAGTAQ